MISLRVFNLLILLGLGMGVTAQAQEVGFPVQHLPREGNSVRDFIPGGWAIEQQVSGDLNGDDISDIAVILVQDKPDSDEGGVENERLRAMIILLGIGKNKLTLAGTNDNLLQCKACGGVKEGVDIEIKKEVVILSQMSGSREYTDETWRFRYQPRARRFILIGMDIENADSILGKGKIESFNYLAGMKVIEIYRYREASDRTVTVSRKKRKCPRKTPFLEDVGFEY
ncbi:MAG: hypothetical protein PHE55_20320 [Methylococcaceae bacterium]|nr:hypothetical protein [Methylococcaceae bacterium]